MPRAVFAPNPFDCQGPIQRRELFFDREPDVKRVLAWLRRGQSVSIVGPEKIGKTSLLHYVSNLDVGAQHGLGPRTHLFFYIDCKRLVALDGDTCYRRIRSIVERAVSPWGEDCISALEGIAPSEAYYWLGQALSLFQDRGVQAIIQLDDFRWLASNDRLSPLFFGSLRALASTYDALIYPTTSRVPLGDLERDVSRIAGSPFFHIFRQYELQPFEPDEARRFLLTRLASVGAIFPDIILERISDLTEG